MATKDLTVINGVPTFQTVLPTIYDQTFSVVTTITSGSNVTLPASGTYNSNEMLVFRNGQLMTLVSDFNYVGTAPRTQVTFTFDLTSDDAIRFVILRNI